MTSNEGSRPAGAWQEAFLVLLRMGIGWHLLYEGLVKVLSPAWSSAPFLADSRWVFSGAFHWIAAHPTVLRVVDLLNVWGLVLIGMALLLGAFSRFAAVSGIVLLALYYVASPPLVGLPANGAAEGSYLIVNKNLVELGALAVVLVTGSGRAAGLDRIIHRLLRRRPRPAEA
jgi:thiosulfate dehydrogenase [quinone] large subunit